MTRIIRYCLRSKNNMEKGGEAATRVSRAELRQRGKQQGYTEMEEETLRIPEISRVLFSKMMLLQKVLRNFH